MDLKDIARIKISSRLKPAKDIHVAYSDILANTEPGRCEELKNNFILAIDSAEVEYKILKEELVVMSNLIQKWNAEFENCKTMLLNLEDQNFSLTHEKGEIEQEKQKADKLKQMKETLIKEKPQHKIEETVKIMSENENKKEEIEKVEKTNEKRKVGFQQIVEGFEKFLLLEKTPVDEAHKEETKLETPKEE